VSRAPGTLLVLLLILLATATPVAANEPAAPKAPAVLDDAPDGPVPGAAAAGEVVPGEVIVKWRNADRGPKVARTRGLAVVAEVGAPGKGLSLVATRGRPVDAVVAALQADPDVEYAEPNYVVSLAGSVSVNDPQTSGQYSLDRMRVRHAWGRSTGASNLIAVLDTGVQSGHSDLKGRVVKGYDFVNDDTGAGDDNGHGTWVAGIIAANANDSYGIAGISWSDRILPVKIMNANGTGSTADLASGIYWAAGKRADVINMSVGGFPYSQAVLDAVNYAWNKGAVLVGAAGNNARRENYYPASYDRVISVSATQVNDEFSYWSSYGPKVNVSAPGSSVLTTNCTVTKCPNRGWGSHTYISGTSFATPNVAGVVALIRAKYPSYTPAQVVSRLYSTVDDLGYGGRDDRYGLGRVNAHRALGASVSQPARVARDDLEGNDGMSSATHIPRSSTSTPTIHPAGDVDWFRVNAPRAGRLDIAVTGVVDTRAYPWNKSSLKIDPVVELYAADGTFIKRVDNVWESGTELAQHSVGGATHLLVRITNYFPNGNARRAYTVTPTFVDTVAPAVTTVSPGGGSSDVTQWVVPTARFNETVTNVSTTTVRLRDMSTFSVVPATVTYDASRREVKLAPATRLVGAREYRFELGAGITDVAGNKLSATHLRFTTSDVAFSDIAGTPFEAEIEWIADEGITTGCGGDRFCPTRKVTRGQMATFLSRALGLPAADDDHFTDDTGSVHEPHINRIAEAGITTGCGGSRYCPDRELTRAETATFLSRALTLGATNRDYFTDDAGIYHERHINRLAAAGLTEGCSSTTYCPTALLTRQQMAAFLYRAFGE
jgi:subtilisin family serine protease